MCHVNVSAVVETCWHPESVLYPSIDQALDLLHRRQHLPLVIADVLHNEFFRGWIGRIEWYPELAIDLLAVSSILADVDERGKVLEGHIL